MGDVQLMSGEFKFLVPLAKAVEGEDGDLYVEGVASDTGLDRQGERIGIKGQESMVRWAKSGTVALGGEADHYHIAFDDDLGYLVDGHVTDKGEFFIRALLDKDNPRAVGLWRMLRKGKKLGLSVFGKITEFHIDDDGVPVIDGVELTRVMVTPTPANPRTWLEYVSKALVIEEGNEMGVERAMTEGALGKVGGAAKAEWTTEYINSLPDEAFAVIEPAYLEGDTEDKRARHLPHHNENVTDPDDDDTVDEPHLINALARVNQIKPITDSISAEELREKARAHLEAHAERLGIGEAGEDAEKAVGDGGGESVEAAKDESATGPSESLESDAPEAAKQEPGPEAGQEADVPDRRAAAKGMFRDALQQLAEEQEKWAPLLEQYERLEGISELVEVLWSVLMEIDDRAAFSELSPEEAAALLDEAIEEFKAEV
ncbi:MAG TPA: hypothetical protein EYH32_01260, partial [Anaerolineae bacterium]|nr:hypothetical protein [Anaerolineae bacterium]